KNISRVNCDFFNKNIVFYVSICEILNNTPIFSSFENLLQNSVFSAKKHLSINGEKFLPGNHRKTKPPYGNLTKRMQHMPLDN
ncbi:MAG: hypothetical protein ACI4UV_20110, partial [Victivallales bacterium]